jgi:thiosulfate/3-mercaptopyruvate sulfurtransferase
MSTLPLLVDTEWLAANLDEPDLRILDSTTNVIREAGRPDRIVAERTTFEAGHIPGAQFVDLQAELSNRDSRLNFTVPTAADFARSIERFGIGEATRVVVYSSGSVWWATRVWWLLRLFGFDHAAILDGGWQAWIKDKRPIETGPGHHRAPGHFTVRAPRPLIADKEDVLAAISNGTTCTINALAPSVHNGVGPSPYGRPGHIKGSVNVPGLSLIDPATNRFLPRAEIEQLFRSVGALDRDKVISYCGGGITATATAFALALIGRPDALVYDASLQEWAPDESLPIETVERV